MASNRATVGLYIDKSQNPDGGVCAVYVRITYKRLRWFYSLPKKYELPEGRLKNGLTIEDFEKATGPKPRGDYKTIAAILNTYKSRAVTVVDKLDTRFSKIEFEKEYLGSQRAKLYLKDAFDDYAKLLRAEGRIGTAVSHECARNSFENFKKGAEFTQVTPKFLQDYENQMLSAGNSPTTIGIYARNLRTILKKYTSLNPESYPFGLRQHGKYEIPTSENQKKALTTEQIKSIRDYEALPGSPEAKARDFWLFIYYCNGINIKDIALLKHSNIEGDTLSFVRAKTVRTKKKQTTITVKLINRAKGIIDTWCNKPGEPYLFPILTADLTPAQQYEKLHDFRAFVNEYMKKIGDELGIPRLTSYVGRHSFATTLKNKGFEVAYISESLGHSNVNTTQRYLDSFGNERKHAAAAALDEL